MAYSYEELMSAWENETNDPETQEWRDDLTADERKLVEQWDDNYEQGLAQMILRSRANSEKFKKLNAELNDPDSAKRAKALEMYLDDDIPVALLEKAMQDSNPDVRCNVMFYCQGKENTPAALIEAGIKDTCDYVQLAALKASNGRSDISLDAIRHALKNPHISVASAAIDAYRAGNYPAIQEVVPPEICYVCQSGDAILRVSIPADAQIRQVNGELYASKGVILDAIHATDPAREAAMPFYKGVPVEPAYFDLRLAIQRSPYDHSIVGGLHIYPTLEGVQERCAALRQQEHEMHLKHELEYKDTPEELHDWMEKLPPEDRHTVMKWEWEDETPYSESREWRNGLSPEDRQLVEQWDAENRMSHPPVIDSMGKNENDTLQQNTDHFALDEPEMEL